MNLLEVLPQPLRQFVSTSRCGFSSESMTYLYLKNNGDLERTLRSAAETEVRWQMALERFAKRALNEERLRAREKDLRTAQKAKEIKSFLLS